jgi:hypothetical protein
VDARSGIAPKNLEDPVLHFLILRFVWIIGIAIGVPVFIMIILFLAVWMQELGWI